VDAYNSATGGVDAPLVSIADWAIVNGVAVLVVLNMMPVLAGQLVRALQLSASDIGMFASAETIGIALGALVAIPGLRQASPFPYHRPIAVARYGIDSVPPHVSPTMVGRERRTTANAHNAASVELTGRGLRLLSRTRRFGHFSRPSGYSQGSRPIRCKTASRFVRRSVF
jgi:hypothetical protein